MVRKKEKMTVEELKILLGVYIDENRRLNAQLDACGYATFEDREKVIEPKKGDYSWSVSLDRVQKLRKGKEL